MQQFAQLPAGHADPFRFRLGHREHRAADRRRRDGCVPAAAALPLPAQQQDRDVVLAAVGEGAGGVVGGGAVDGLDQGVGEFLEASVVGLQDGADALPAGLEVVAAGLDQSVGAEHERLAGLQDDPGRGVVGVRVDAQREAAFGVAGQDRAVGLAGRRVGMPGPRHLQDAGHRIGFDVQAGREARVGGASTPYVMPLRKREARERTASGRWPSAA